MIFDPKKYRKYKVCEDDGLILKGETMSFTLTLGELWQVIINIFSKNPTVLNNKEVTIKKGTGTFYKRK